MQKIFAIDTETYGPDIRKTGAFAYVADAHFRVRLVSYGYLDGPIKTWQPERNPTPPQELDEALSDKRVLLLAHNAIFDRNALNQIAPVYGLPVVDDPNRWLDTMAMCRACGLPPALEDAAVALNLTERKDRKGKALIRLFSREQTHTKKNGGGAYMAGAETHPEEWAQFIAYAEQDVRTMIDLFRRLPKLTDTEQRVFVADQMMNEHGVTVDTSAMSALADIERELAGRSEDFVVKTTGVRPTQRDKLLAWYKTQGLRLPNMQQDTIAAALTEENLTPLVRDVIEAARLTSSAALRKPAGMLLRLSPDGRIRGAFNYHGAQTGRWSSQGVQLQNLKRTSMSPSDMNAIFDIITTTSPSVAVDILMLRYGNPAEVLSELIRGLFIPDPPDSLLIYDYSKIELVTAMLLAGETGILQRITDGVDEYRAFAAEHLAPGLPENKISGHLRHVAKAAVLGCQYLMGPPRFAEQTGVEMEMAKRAVFGFRSRYPGLPQLWKDIEAAIVASVRTGKEYRFSQIEGVSSSIDGDFLCLNLPSGRTMRRFKPEVRVESKNGRRNVRLAYQKFENGKGFTDKPHAGQMTEWVASGLARDLLANALVETTEAGLNPVMSVHDELVCSSNPNYLNDMRDCMTSLPDWASGWPVTVEGGTASRYCKI